MDKEAFFISPDCHFLFVPEKHIDLICDRPELFGLSAEALRHVFAKHGEAWSSECHARNEIIAGLLSRGWIRVRLRSEKRRGNLCLFQLDALTEDVTGRLQKFVELIASSGIHGVEVPSNTSISIKLANGCEITDGWATLATMSKYLKRV
jgi:hypothetical protein